ncbi:MAG TPA: hypothetical protein VMT20_06955 [Terriglobia bacterium]|nr:hypothetical protein [Terriglobia bacterium]
MAEEAYIVAFGTKQAGSGFQFAKNSIREPTKTAGVGLNKKTTIGYDVEETGGLAEKEEIDGGGVAQCYLIEVKSESAAEAIEAVREYFPTLAKNTVCRAVVKPNTNFKAVA